MKLEDEANIWGRVDQLSGRDRGRIFAQRAAQILSEALINPEKHSHLLHKGRIRRQALASLIGCHRSVLSENAQVVALLAKVEAREPIHSLGIDSDKAIAETEIAAPVRLTLRKLQKGAVISGRRQNDRIVTTGRRFRWNDVGYEIPTIIWPEGIDEVASDWLRHVVIRNIATTSSAKQYAKILRAFLRHCREKNRPWSTVDDDFLRSWRDRRRNDVDDQTVLSDLAIVFQYYAWAEETGYLKFHVGIYDKSEFPEGFSRGDFPITARRISNRRGRTEGWTTTLRFRASRAVEGRRNTPTDDQVISVHEALLKRQHGERDTLIAAWAEEGGPRRMEVLQVRLSDIPSAEELSALIQKDEDAEVQIKHRKRGSKAPLKINPYLLIQTRDWINGGRRNIVEHCLNRITGYKEPKEVFISSTTGKVLHPDSVTKIFGMAFKEGGVPNASLHRLRAKAIVEIVEELVDGFLEMGIAINPDSHWADTVLVMAAELAGHATPSSLRPYLNFVLSRRLANTEAHRRARVAKQTRYVERRNALANAALQDQAELSEAVRLLRGNKKKDARNLLIKFVEQLDERISDDAPNALDVGPSPDD